MTPSKMMHKTVGTEEVLLSIIWWEAIGNGLETERWQVLEAIGASGLKKASMVVFGVDKCYMKAFVMQDFG